jgi:hypothetical protein
MIPLPQRCSLCSMFEPMGKLLMKNILGIAVSLAIAFLLSASASAQQFSADMVSRSADGKLTKSKLYQTADKERFDSTVEIKPGASMETHLIIDRREKLIYLVEPQQKTILVNHVLQIASDSSRSGSSSSNPCEELMHAINPVVAKQQFACKQVGYESVNGRSAEIWQMDSKWWGSGSAYLWVDAQIKATIKWTLPDGSSGELQNIKVEAQSASLFELPADYRKQDLPH